MGIPALVAIHHGDGQFDEANAPLDQPPSDQALPRIGLSVFVFGIEAVKLFRGFGFAV